MDHSLVFLDKIITFNPTKTNQNENIICVINVKNGPITHGNDPIIAISPNMTPTSIDDLPKLECFITIPSMTVAMLILNKSFRISGDSMI